MTPSGLHLFSPDWFKAIDRTTCVERWPPIDAPCPVNRGPDCGYPFCTNPCPYSHPVSHKEDT